MVKQIESMSENNENNNRSANLQEFSLKLLELGYLGKPGIVFARETARLLWDFFECDHLEVWIKESQSCLRCQVIKDASPRFKHSTIPCRLSRNSEGWCECGPADAGLKFAGLRIDELRISGEHTTHRGSYCINDIDALAASLAKERSRQDGVALSLEGGYKSIAVIPIRVGDAVAGRIVLKNRKAGLLTGDDISFLEGAAQAVGIARAHQQTQAALKERIKELSCLYGIAKLFEQPSISLEDILVGIVNLIPPGWQYPGITHGRIILDGRIFTKTAFKEVWQSQHADIIIKGEKRGAVEVAYSKRMPQLDEGPFLNEERNLIEAIAIQVAQIVERRKAEDDQRRLQEQLRHADRLATIGQLAAGVAHEFNEPLGNILGFAQLILKSEELPGGVEDDIEKIVTASMHAREVVKKLMLFSRQLPAVKTKTNLNVIVDEGLYFLEARCVKAGIEIVRKLDKSIPDMTADASQMHQVLVNLIVNAIQAMPDGGTITISTGCSGDYVNLAVEDTGIGMSAETVKQIFIPFFTTKDIDEGTGLGLPVVHGIVTSHFGMISVESEIGKGSRFEIKLPVTEIQ